MALHRKARGFTLMELLIVVFIAGVLAVLAYWNLGSVVPQWRLRSTASDVRGALAFARARAIAQNRTYLVQFQSGGYRVWWDKTADGVSMDDELVREESYAPGVAYVRPAVDPLPAGDVVRFAPNGLATNISVGGQYIGVVNTAGSRQVQVYYTGLAKRR